jgi:hypothetical protein
MVDDIGGSKARMSEQTPSLWDVCGCGVSVVDVGGEEDRKGNAEQHA